MYRKKIQLLAETALLAAFITISGAFKLPGLLPGTEFQLSAPVAVAVCGVFGIRKYLAAGILSSAVGLLLGTQNVFNVLIRHDFPYRRRRYLLFLWQQPLLLPCFGPYCLFACQAQPRVCCRQSRPAACRSGRSRHALYRVVGGAHRCCTQKSPGRRHAFSLSALTGRPFLELLPLR